MAAPGRTIYKKLAWLNELPQSEAEYVFRECGGSHDWARAMAAARPFPMLGQLFTRAASEWEKIDDSSFEAVQRRLEKLLER